MFSKNKELNYLFYNGEKSRKPGGESIEELLKTWTGDYERLEDDHGFIQWLFPVFESKGMNVFSQELTKQEAKKMRKDFNINIKFLKAYILMLDFYGLKIVDLKTGEIDRNRHWRERFQNISKHQHNCLRISRIIISLGELGFERYKKPFVQCLKSEILEGRLKHCNQSLKRFWEPLLNHDSEEYKKKTKETEKDRKPSIFILEMDRNEKFFYDKRVLGLVSYMNKSFRLNTSDSEEDIMDETKGNADATTESM